MFIIIFKGCNECKCSPDGKWNCSINKECDDLNNKHDGSENKRSKRQNFPYGTNSFYNPYTFPFGNECDQQFEWREGNLICNCYYGRRSCKEDYQRFYTGFNNYNFNSYPFNYRPVSFQPDLQYQSYRMPYNVFNRIQPDYDPYFINQFAPQVFKNEKRRLTCTDRNHMNSDHHGRPMQKITPPRPTTPPRTRPITTEAPFIEIVSPTEIPTFETTILPEEVLNTTERSVTLEELKDPNFTCVPGQPFTLECNTCWCAKNGKEPRTCTRIACKPKVYKPLGSNPPLSDTN